MASAARRSRLTRSAGSGESRLASSHERAADAGAPRCAVTAAAASRALATASSGTDRGPGEVPRPRRGVGRQRAGERPVGGPAIRSRRVVVGGRPHQRVAERQPIAVEADDAGGLGGLQVGHAEPTVAERLGDPHEVAVGLGGGDEQRRPHGRVESLEEQVDDALAGAPDRQRVGQLCPTGALVGVEEVGGLDEHERQATAGGHQLPPDARRW